MVINGCVDGLIAHLIWIGKDGNIRDLNKFSVH